VRAGLPQTSVEALVTAYLSGQLTDTPNGCEHHGHEHGHEHGHHHHHRHHAAGGPLHEQSGEDSK
jgi:hypothetical protein